MLRRARRPLTTLLLALTLGFTTSIAIAWARALVDLSGHMAQGGDAFASASGRGFSVEVNKHIGLTWVHTFTGPFDEVTDPPTDVDQIPYWSTAYHELVEFQSADRSSRLSDTSIQETAAGWPLRCLMYRSITEHPAQNRRHATEGGFNAIPFSIPFIDTSNGPPTPNQLVDFTRELIRQPGQPVSTIVPITPIPAGLAANTTFFFVAWLLPVTPLKLLKLIKRRSRQRRSRCRACNFELDQTTTRCPECGLRTDQHIPIIKRRTNITLAVVLAILALPTITVPIWRHAKMPDLPPIHRAITTGNTEKIARLIDEGYDIDQQLAPSTAFLAFGFSPGPATPVQLAVFTGQNDALALLLSAGADPNIHCNHGRHSLVADLDETNPALVNALVGNNLEAAQLLVDHGADPSANKFSAFLALHLAVTWDLEDNHTALRNSRYHELYMKLLEATPPMPSIDAHAREILTTTIIAMGVPFWTEPLMERDALKGLSPQQLVYPLIAAMQLEDTTLFDQILAMGPDVNHIPAASLTDPSPDTRGASPLMRAVASNNLHATLALLRAGADPTLKSPMQRGAFSSDDEATPIEYAMGYTDPETGAIMLPHPQVSPDLVVFLWEAAENPRGADGSATPPAEPPAAPPAAETGRETPR